MRKAIIIGAGPAGLTAAYELLKKTDIQPIVIEQGTQVGGLSRTIDFHGNKIDIGGHRFFSKSPKVVDWWLHFLPLQEHETTGPSHITYRNQQATIKTNKTVSPQPGNNTEDVMLLRPRKSSIYFEGKFFGYPLQLTFSTMRKLGFSKVLSFAFSYTGAKLAPIQPELTLEDFFINRFGRALYRTFFKSYTEKVWGVPCNELPASWGKQRVKSLNIAKVLRHAIRSLFTKSTDIHQRNTQTSLIEQFLYPTYGPGQMWEKVADTARQMGAVIHMNTRVVALHADTNNSLRSVVIQKAGADETEVLEADYFISTMPVKTLLRNLYGLNMPPLVRASSESLQYRDFLIVGILTGEDGIKPGITDNWIYIQDKGILAGRVQFFHNWSPRMVQAPDTQWIGVEYFCNETDAFWQQDDATIARFAVEEMSKIHLLDANKLKDTLVVRVKKAYPSYFGGYRDFDQVKQFLDAINNLFPIGRNGMHRYNNTDHSMLTAMAAVENIAIGKTDKTNIWAVNTDDEYHEETQKQSETTDSTS